MKPKNSIQHDKKIEFKLIEVKKLRYFENNPSEYHLTVDAIQQADVKIGINLTVNKEEETISFYILSVFIYPDREKRYELFGIETLHTYKVKFFTQHFKKSDIEEYTIPDDLMFTFLSVAISGTRGMLAVLNTTPAYNHLFLPLLNPHELLEKLKERNRDSHNKDSNN